MAFYIMGLGVIFWAALFRIAVVRKDEAINIFAFVVLASFGILVIGLLIGQNFF